MRGRKPGLRGRPGAHPDLRGGKSGGAFGGREGKGRSFDQAHRRDRDGLARDDDGLDLLLGEESAVELGHGLQRGLLGAGLDGDACGPACGEDFRGKAGELQIVLQGLALLSEGAAKELVEGFRFDAQLGEPGGEVKSDYRRKNVRGWVKSGRGQSEEEVHLGIHLRSGGEETVVADTGGGGDPVGDLALHHENGAV